MKTFNLIINGIGGQGIITLLTFVDEAAFIEGYDVKSSELHGLSQRGGSVETHVRFGKKVNSPLIPNGEVDLVISMELLEGLRGVQKAGKNTKFLINDWVSPFQGPLSSEEIKKQLALIKNEIYFLPASGITSGVYILGYAVSKKMIPIKKESALKAIDNMVPEKYKELNIKAFKLGY